MCPQCNQPANRNTVIRLYLNTFPTVPNDPLELLDSLKKALEVNKYNQIKTVNELHEKIKIVEKTKENIANQFKNELLAEQEIRK